MAGEMAGDPWTETLNKIKTIFQVDKDSPALAEALAGDPLVPHVAQGFVFDDTNEDKVHFRYLHVEPLLEQAATLLDRILVDRAAYERLSTEFFNAKLQIMSFLRLDAIHDQEEAAGYYELAHNEVLGKLNSENAVVAQTPVISAAIDDLAGKYTKPAIDRLVELARVAADNALLPYSTAPAAAMRNYPTILPSLEPQQVIGREIAGEERLFQLGCDLLPHVIAQREQVASVNARQARIAALTFAEAYLGRDVGFRKARTEVSKDVLKIRINELCRDNGALNFEGRMTPIKARVSADLMESMARIRAIGEGLKNVYGINIPPPELHTDTIIDEAITWVRSAVNRLGRILRLDQNYVYRVSLASKVSPETFSAGLQTSWRFDLDRNEFPHQCLTRVRGLAAFSRDNADGIYQISVRVPEEGQTLHRGETTPQLLDQQDIPRCWLGRVGARAAERDSDIVGAQALHNCSPIGTWEIELGTSAMRDLATKNNLEDIELDIYLAVQELIGG